jgi:hypothetical protein
MRKTALSFALALTALGSASVGCMPSINNLDTGPLTTTFAVSDVYTPSGYMGDGEYFGNLVGQVNEGCKEPRPPGARGNCYVFTYYPNTVNQDPWAGVYWVYPANNWGDTYGHAIDSSKFQQIRFYAAIEAPMPYTFSGAPQPFNALVGNINPMTNFDNKGGVDHADALYATTAAAVGTEITSDLKQFHIQLTDFAKGQLCYYPPTPAMNGMPAMEGATFAPNCETVTNAQGMQIQVANDLIAAFGWAIHYPGDTTTCADATMPCPTSKWLNVKPVKIYLDDIVWDTEPAPAP